MPARFFLPMIANTFKFVISIFDIEPHVMTRPVGYWFSLSEDAHGKRLVIPDITAIDKTFPFITKLR